MNFAEMVINILITFNLTIGLGLKPASELDEKCSSYMGLFTDYQRDKQDLLACGVSPDMYFFAETEDENQHWCEQAKPLELEKRFNEAGLVSLHCGGTAHYLSIENDETRMEKYGLIRALYEPEIKAAPVSDTIRSAIIANPGKKSGTSYEMFPVGLLEGKEPECRLQGVKLNLAADTEISHWLVSAEPPCQRDKERNSPFWLLEEKNGHYRVLLAYRTFGTVSIENHHHNGYAQVNITRQLSDGNDADISWQYRNGSYEYLSSSCSNLERMDDSEPVFIQDCLKGETWH